MSALIGPESDVWLLQDISRHHLRALLGAGQDVVSLLRNEMIIFFVV